METGGRKLETTAPVGSDGGTMSPSLRTAPPARGTAWTIVLFLGGALGLSAAPGVPDDLRPLPLQTDTQRVALATKIFARPKMTLAEHERRLEGHVDEGVQDDGVDDADDPIELADARALHDERHAERDLAALAVVPAPPAAEQEAAAVAVDRAAVVARAEGKKVARLREQHRALKMPGGVVDNPCIAKDDDGDCDRTALDPLFSTFDAIARGDDDARAAVVVLGNSLIASDHVTDILRGRLQEAFGDAGRGFLLPERLVKDVGRRVRTGQGSDGWIVHHFAKDPPFADGVRFGFSGAVYEASVTGEHSRFDVDGARSARLFWLDTGKGLRLDVDGKTWLTVPPGEATLAGEQAAKHVEIRLPPLSKELKLVADAGARVFGVALERDRRGVMVDTIGVPAASTKLYTEAVDRAVFVEQLRARAPTLLVAMLGGNETRALSWGALDEATLTARLSTLIDSFKEAAPSAACLVVTPIDAGKTTTADDTLVTRPEIHTVIAVQRKVAAEKGCGFFDLFAAMGGTGSLQRMREQKLVSDDLVHPTARGGDVLGQLFADAMLRTYRETRAGSEQLAHRRRARDDDAGDTFVGLSFPTLDEGPVTVGAPTTKTKRPRPLSRFFARLAALEGGTGTRVAIGQFGASHTAGQSLTDRMRARLAARYGGAGPGFVAVGTASKRQVPAGVVRDIVGAFDITDGREVVAGGALGMAGMKARLLPGGKLSVGFCEKCSARAVEGTPGSIQLAWLYTPDMGTADVLVDGERLATVTPSSRRTDSDVQFLRVMTKSEKARIEVVSRATPEPSSQGTDGLSPVGPVHILGVVEELERPGVVLDAVGLPGTTGMTPQRWRQDLYAEEVKSRRYDLIVTAWGTNEAGIASLDATTYKHHFGNTLKTLQGAAPDADCLIVGASDRFDQKPGGLVPAPNHELVERVQKELAAEHGCAFFSMRDAMGGPGSMKQWVKDGLALPDHVHFTREGYQKMADILIDDLLAAASKAAPRAGAAVADETREDDDDILSPPVPPSSPSPSSPSSPSSPTLPTLAATPAGKTASLTTLEEAPRALP
jgi:lysophospholipase L1-like esterase